MAFMLHNTVKNNALDFRAINESISVLWFKTRFFSVSSINAYTPTEDKDSEYKEEFYKMLEKHTIRHQVMTKNNHWKSKCPNWSRRAISWNNRHTQ
jgi:hypothetical protein